MPVQPLKIFTSKEIAKYVERLEPNHKHVKWINDMKENLQRDPFCGEKIMKNRIPKYYKEMFSVHTLFRYAHPEGYRSIYTLYMLESGLCPVILEFMNHKQYEQKFGYSGSL